MLEPIPQQSKKLFCDAQRRQCLQLCFVWWSCCPVSDSWVSTNTSEVYNPQRILPSTGRGHSVSLLSATRRPRGFKRGRCVQEHQGLARTEMDLQNTEKDFWHPLQIGTTSRHECPRITLEFRAPDISMQTFEYVHGSFWKDDLRNVRS